MFSPIGVLNSKIKDVHVWGAGISGLLLANHLHQLGYQVFIYEKSSDLGGKISTNNSPYGIIEGGPNGIYATEEIISFVKELKLTPLTVTKNLKRLIWRNKITNALSPSLICKIPFLFKTPPISTFSTSIQDFFSPFLGEKLTTELLTPALQGIYGVSSDKLSLWSVWPQLAHKTFNSYLEVLLVLKKEKKAKTISFADGMKEFIEALAHPFKNNIQFNTTNFILRPNTIICTSAHEAAELLQSAWQTGANELHKISYTPINSTTVFFKENIPWTQSAFGLLFPQNTGMNSLGVLFNHEIFPRNRVLQDARASLTFIASTAINLEEDLNKLSLNSDHILFSQNYSYKNGLPIYDSARYLAVTQLNEIIKTQKDLILFGNYTSGISIREMYEASKRIKIN